MSGSLGIQASENVRQILFFLERPSRTRICPRMGLSVTVSKGTAECVSAFLTMNAVTSAGDVEVGGLFSRKRLGVARLGLDGGEV